MPRARRQPRRPRSKKVRKRMPASQQPARKLRRKALLRKIEQMKQKRKS